MIVARNVVLLVTAAAAATVVSYGLFGTMVPPPPPAPPASITVPTNATLPGGIQVALGQPNGVTPPVVTTTPKLPNDATGGINGSTGPPANSQAPLDFVPNYAATAAQLFQPALENLRASAGVPPLAYDPVLGQAAANLIADVFASGKGFPPQATAVNSQGLTPIQQVLAIAPGSTVTSVSVISRIGDLSNPADAQNPANKVNDAINTFAVDNNKIPLNAGWTHFGFAVVAIPATSTNYARTYFVVFYAKE